MPFKRQIWAFSIDKRRLGVSKFPLPLLDVLKPKTSVDPNVPPVDPYPPRPTTWSIPASLYTPLLGEKVGTAIRTDDKTPASPVACVVFRSVSEPILPETLAADPEHEERLRSRQTHRNIPNETHRVEDSLATSQDNNDCASLTSPNLNSSREVHSFTCDTDDVSTVRNHPHTGGTSRSDSVRHPSPVVQVKREVKEEIHGTHHPIRRFHQYEETKSHPISTMQGGRPTTWGKQNVVKREDAMVKEEIVEWSTPAATAPFILDEYFVDLMDNDVYSPLSPEGVVSLEEACTAITNKRSDFEKKIKEKSGRRFDIKHKNENKECFEFGNHYPQNQ